MASSSSILATDKKYIWHPFEVPESMAATPITHARGVHIFTEDGKTIIDAISSWWLNLHGHAHPKITEAIRQQAEKLHHVIFAGFTHQPATDLAERLMTKLPANQHKLFFSDNGSTAVEVALKLCIQYWKNIGQKRTKIVALENGYHGDTFGAMSAGARSIFVEPFKEHLFEVAFLQDIHANPDQTIEQFCALAKAGEVAAFIFEPLVQGAGGMLMHQPVVLDELLSIANQYDIRTIADEVMTGFGRTGKWFATDYLTQKPDCICLSKGLTGGTLPLSITSCSELIFSAFDSVSRDKGFFHGHSFTGNPLACAAAVASFDLLNTDECWKRIGNLCNHQTAFKSILENHPKVSAARNFGTITAANIRTSLPSSYTNPVRDVVMNFCLERGVMIRPLGDLVYILPPYCITYEELLEVYETLIAAIDTVP